jgi:hypothetical protein
MIYLYITRPFGKNENLEVILQSGYCNAYQGANRYYLNNFYATTQARVQRKEFLLRGYTTSEDGAIV